MLHYLIITLAYYYHISILSHYHISMKRFFLSLLVVGVAACKPEPSPPYVYETSPHYTYMGLSHYGKYYAGNDNHVFALTLYSEGMVNEDSTAVEPPGQELYFEDLFVPEENFGNLQLTDEDTVLTEAHVLALLRGTYRASGVAASDSFGLAYSFAPGEYVPVDSTTYILGARITYYEEDEAYSKRELITGGSFTVSDAGIDFSLLTEGGDTLGGMYQAAAAKRVAVKMHPGRTREAVSWLDR